MALAPETCVVVVINRGIAPFLDENGGLKVAPMVRPLSDEDMEWIRAHKEKLIEGLTPLKGTGTNDKGLYYFPQGKKYYQYLVNAYTGTS